MRLALFLVLGAAKGLPAAQFPDTTRIFREARSAEAEYERAGRRFAAIAPSRGRGTTCDEVVGRFCLYYDTGRDTLPTEPAEITNARDRALAKLRTAFEQNKARLPTVFALVRLLLEGRRPLDAVRVAEEFRDAASDVATARMLLGLTRHYAADIPGAERAFADWLETQDSASAARITDVRWLLDGPERRRYRRLSGEARRRYENVFWRYADALYLTPGNETYTEHLARHAEIPLIKAAPVVVGATSWGNDLSELLIRYGSPRARTRDWPARFGETEQITEHYDPEQMSYAPPALDSALRTYAKPGNGWPLDTVRSVTGHAPSTVRRMVYLEHQASISFNDSMRVLQVHGAVPLDSAARQKEARVMLFALDAALNIVVSAPGVARMANDSMFISAQVPLPRNAEFYSAEVLEDSTRLAARGRFRVNDRRIGTMRMSDVMIAEPLKSGDQLRVLHSLVLPRARPVGIYAEAELPPPRPRHVRVRLRVLDGRGRLTRTSLSWIEEVNAGGRAAIATTVATDNLRPGRYVLELSLTDQDGGSATSSREILIRSK